MKLFRNLPVHLSVISITVIFVAICQADDTKSPTVNLKQGQASGKTMKSINGKTFNAFLGIPYGKVLEKFTAPVPAEPWNGIRDATKDGNPCKQFDALIKRKMFGEEDCLVLNVYTPNLPTEDGKTGLLPVIVFIHGGGFNFGEGTSTIFGPERYMNAKNPFVLVVMNYRVGPLGFLSTNDEASPGNYGLLDQQLALKWIQENIDKFGGDPKRVVISGESAGGASIIYHMLSKNSSGLFHAAIAQSGSSLCPWAIDENPLESSKKIAEFVQCPTESTSEMMKCLRNKDADAIIQAATNLSSSIIFPNLPVVEPSQGGNFLTEAPLKLLTEGNFNKVPVITGVTADESSLVVLLLSNNSLLPPVESDQDKNWDDIITKLLFGKNDFDQQTIDKIKEMYFTGANYSDINDIRSRQVKLSSDANFKSCNDKTARLLSAAGVPVYMYVFDYATKDLSPTNYSGKPDVGHLTDLFFLFNYTQFGDLHYSDEANAVSDQFLDLWTNFATSGNPTPSGPVQWNPTKPGEIQYFNISQPMSMNDGYETEAMKFWDGLLYK